MPHPLDRTPRVPAEGRLAAPGHPDGATASPRATGRSEASGAFRTPGRSSISDAFGIAGRAARAEGRSESSGSYFVPANETLAPARRGETSGAYPAAGRGPSSGAQPARRGEASGAYPAAVEPAVAQSTRRGEASGAYPAAVGVEPAAARPGRRGKARREETVAEPARRGEASGTYPAAAEPAARSTRRGETSAAYATAVGVEPTRRGEASGSYPVAEPARRGETSGSYPAAVRVEPAAARPGRRGKARREETAAERTEVIARLETADERPVAPREEASGSFRAVADVRTAGRDERTDVTGESEGTGKRRARREGTTEGEGRRRAPGRGDTTGPHRTSGKGEATGSHRVVGKGEATGSHRIVGKKAPRRRIATWPIACLVLAVLIGLGVIGWNWADNELNSRAEAQAASCSGGTSQMRVVVTPSVQKPLAAAAERWNQAATVVHGQCVKVTIDPKASAQVLDALVGRAGLDSIGGLPAAWLPESSYWVSELTTKKPEMIGSPAQSVANARSADYPFVGLSGPGIDDTVLRAAQTFREYLEQPTQQADFAAAGIKTA
ncbi:hypothetical protein [Amycolatopsis sp. NPDC021455]|uniref:hypothetical protein n=1 Tax=Amycolatopsis sp. NPDC021455 TaxID=3154901 RepID=UPI0033EDF54D